MTQTHQLVSELRSHYAQMAPHQKERKTAELIALSAAALTDAADIIAKVGTTGIEYEHRNAEAWLKKYFPERV